jgi:hypothetical protein
MKQGMFAKLRTLILIATWIVTLVALLFQHDHLLMYLNTHEPPEPAFAGCLLVMDDNHLLPEWLAYHFFAVSLRSLIVAVDPRSKTSPAKIFERWKNSPLNITVWWNDEYFNVKSIDFNKAKAQVEAKFKKQPSPSVEVLEHRTRQRIFYDHCMKEHKRAGFAYTLLIDTDEYLMVNYDTVRAARRKYVPPGISEPGSVWKTLENERKFHPKDKYTKSACIQIPRLRFGSVETDPLELELGIPRQIRHLNLNATHFSTLRWRTHAPDNDHTVNKLSKAVIDLRRLELKDLKPVTSIHRPVKPQCGEQKMLIHPSNQVRFRSSIDAVPYPCRILALSPIPFCPSSKDFDH